MAQQNTFSALTIIHTFYVKGQFHGDIILLCKNIFLAIIQHHNSAAEGESVTLFHTWLDAGLGTLILAAHLETLLIV